MLSTAFRRGLRGFARRRGSAAFLALCAAPVSGRGGRLFGSSASRLRINALMIFSAARTSRSVRRPLKYAASSLFARRTS